MDAPICRFVREYAESQALRMHMPGHKGAGILGVEHLDITEIPGADVLYHANGIIRSSEENASALFGSGMTLYSTEGSSLSIRAMLYLAKLYGGGKCTIAAGRNAHKVFTTAAALLDIEISWIFPEGDSNMVSCPITPRQLRAHLQSLPTPPTAVYITSPDYLGNMVDIAALAETAHGFDCLLLVDNAHGAYLNFLERSRHPMALGADICCDSAHKTLPVLTGGGYLHIAKSAPGLLAENARRALCMFSSTSPSYLILQSLDAANLLLAGEYRAKLKKAALLWLDVRQELEDTGYCLVGDEPMKLTIRPKSYGYTGEETAQILERQNIFVEFADPDHVVFMLSPLWDGDAADRLKQALQAIPRRDAITLPPPPLPYPELVMAPRKVIFAPTQEVDIHDSLHCVMASASVSCPPAIPIVSIGERIDEASIRAMEYYGIDRIQVIKP